MVRFVLAVKRRFFDISQPEKYRQLLYHLVEYRNGRISMDGVLDGIKAVLHGHPDLVGHFNSLMPSALHITD
ncbi:hypothetical protein BS78_07G088700 [Paspalum vaginatum]|nr:hypothetical protein BS78_07G088700 [Paspalum vaginatum]